MTNGTSILFQLILGRRVLERPGDAARLQRASRSLLQGLGVLLDQGEGCLTQGAGRVHSPAGAEAALRRQQVSVPPLCSLLLGTRQKPALLPEAAAAPELPGGLHAEPVPAGARSTPEPGGPVDSAGGPSPMLGAQGSGAGGALAPEDPGLLPFTGVLGVSALALKSCTCRRSGPAGRRLTAG